MEIKDSTQKKEKKMQPKIYWIADKDLLGGSGRLEHCIWIKTDHPIGGMRPIWGLDFFTLRATFDGMFLRFNRNPPPCSGPGHNFLSPFERDHRVMPTGGSDMSLAQELVRRSLNFERNSRIIRITFDPYHSIPDLLYGSAWVNTLLKASGVPAMERRKAGTFWGNDYAKERNLIREDIFADNPPIPLPHAPSPDRPAPGNGQRTHTVQPGDWLSKIAIAYYGDVNKWRVIYEHPENKRTIGPNPDLIKIGQRLVIP